MGIKVKERIPGPVIFWTSSTAAAGGKPRRLGVKQRALKAEAIEARLVLGNSAFPEAERAAPTLEEYFKRFEKAYLDTATVRD